jgi:hypothetical protein
MGSPVRGRVVMTSGIAGLSSERLGAILGAVVRFTDFTTDNDPYGEHDCAGLDVDGERILWKIDYYADDSLTYGADDPAASCYRVLTIMFATEY